MKYLIFCFSHWFLPFHIADNEEQLEKFREKIGYYDTN